MAKNTPCYYKVTLRENTPAKLLNTSGKKNKEQKDVKIFKKLYS